MTPAKWQQFNMLQDVISHFATNPDELRSSLCDSTCTYYPNLKLSPKSIGCAIGIYLNWKTAKELDNLEQTSIHCILDNKHKTILPLWMQKMNKNFLSDIQALHDDEYHWNSEGLAENGKRYIKTICDKFNLPFSKLTLK